MSKLANTTEAPAWKRAVAFGLRTFTFAGAIFICFEISVWIHPPMLAWGLGLIDSKLICSSAEALRGAQRH